MRRALSIALIMAFALIASAQDAKDALQERLAAVKESQAQNKKNIATYTWQEQDTISLKGQVKKQESYQVVIGADGKPVKTPLNPAPAPSQPKAEGGGRGGRMKEKVIENKKEEFEDYAHQIAALAHEYAAPNPEKLQDAYKQGNVKLGAGKTPDEAALVISNYIKPNDSMTISLNKSTKAIQDVQIASYLDKPDNAVKIGIEFAKLDDGTNHISSMAIDGVSKQLNVAIKNSGYVKK
jgi:hypothetical protein